MQTPQQSPHKNARNRPRDQQRCARNSPGRGLTPRHTRTGAANNPQIAQQLARRPSQQRQRHRLQQSHPPNQQHPHDQPTLRTLQKRMVSRQQQQHSEHQQPAQKVNNRDIARNHSGGGAGHLTNDRACRDETGATTPRHSPQRNRPRPTAQTTTRQTMRHKPRRAQYRT